MQSLLFVFIGLPQNKSVLDLSILQQRLEEKYKADTIAIQFTRKDELLSANMGEVNFYISFLKNKDELNDWFQLAIDFELMLIKNPVTREQLLQRYDEIKKLSPNLYNKVHYATAISIFDTMNTFKEISIFSFQ